MPDFMPTNVTLHEARTLLVFAVIRSAVADYQNKYLKKHQWQIWNDAKRFIFEPGRLEEFLRQFELTTELNCAMLRKHARYGKVTTYGDGVDNESS